MVGYVVVAVMIVFGIVTILGLFDTRSKAIKLNEKREEDRRKSGGRKRLTAEGGMQEEGAVYQYADDLIYLEKLNQIQIKYAIYEQLIPLFPLGGILGTVLGLWRQLGDIAAMREGLSTSISTTIVGLIITIGLRMVDAFWVSTKVNDIALKLDLFERNYQMVKDKFELENK